MTFAQLRKLAVALPGVEESTSYGTPAFKVKKKLLARMHQDGESLVLHMDFDERETLMEADPERFYITDHYLDHPWILVRLAKVKPTQLRPLFEQAWRMRAPARLLRELDA